MVHADITYTLDGQDFRRHFNRKFRLTPARRARQIAGFWICQSFVIAFLLWSSLHWTGRVPLNTVISIALLIAFSIIPTFLFMGYPRIRRPSKEISPSQSPMRMRLTDEGVEVVMADSTSITPWESISHIDEDKWQISFEPASVVRFV